MKPIVLLVDDEPAVIDGLRRGLRKFSYDVIYAYSGNEAVELMAKEHVDVIVADEMMPGMSGSELLACARKTHPKILRIMLTGHASVASAMNAIYDGWVYQYLHKPCEVDALAELISNGLAQMSRQTEKEGSHVIMTNAEQTELLESVSKRSFIERKN